MPYCSSLARLYVNTCKRGIFSRRRAPLWVGPGPRLGLTKDNTKNHDLLDLGPTALLETTECRRRA